jgi:Family of unknown function (DUF6152)
MSRASTRRLAARSAGAIAAGTALGVARVDSAAAHHSFPATYDTAQRVNVSGVVQLVRFTNPHVHIVIEAPVAAVAPPGEPAAAGPEAAAAAPEADAEAYAEAAVPVQASAPDVVPETTLWVLDLPGPGRAQQLGLTPETLPPGTPLSVVAWPPRAAGSHDLAPLTITFDVDGHIVRIR